MIPAWIVCLVVWSQSSWTGINLSLFGRQFHLKWAGYQFWHLAVLNSFSRENWQPMKSSENRPVSICQEMNATWQVERLSRAPGLFSGSFPGGTWLFCWSHLLECLSSLFALPGTLLNRAAFETLKSSLYLISLTQWPRQSIYDSLKLWSLCLQSVSE